MHLLLLSELRFLDDGPSESAYDDLTALCWRNLPSSLSVSPFTHVSLSPPPLSFFPCVFLQRPPVFQELTVLNYY